jgi:hypothetical protein
MAVLGHGVADHKHATLPHFDFKTNSDLAYAREHFVTATPQSGFPAGEKLTLGAK